MARCRAGGDDEHIAGRKRHTAQDVVRKLRRADELAAESKTVEESHQPLQGSVAPNAHSGAVDRWA